MGEPSKQSDLGLIFLAVVDTAIEIAGADFGNIQILDPNTGDLNIVAQRNFPQFWLDFWNNVSKGTGACGTALAQGSRIIVEDVTKSPIFIGKPALEIQLRAGVRAVQSTPLITRTGKVLGMFSTHYKEPRCPLPRDLRLLDLLAQVAADAIEQSQLRIQLEQAVATRDEFLSIASHELKTPLTALKLQLQLIELTQKQDNDSQIKALAQTLTIAFRQIDSLHALIDGMLDTSRIHIGRLTFNDTRSDLSQLVALVVSQFAVQLQKAKCELKLDLKDSVVGHWDPRRIEQIISNLISNAIKYASGKPIRISTDQVGDMAVLTVQDSGPGIPPNLHKRIFERYERANLDKGISGFGLGLYIVKNIVESKGGRVWVESEVGSGSKFITELPLHPTQQ